jgi:hypothetical protein
MSSHILKPLYAATVIATNTTTTGTGYQLHPHAQELIFRSIVSSFTDGVYTTTIQHSPDNTNWYTLAVGSAQNAAGSVIISVPLTQPHFLFIRSSILSTGTTTGATVAVDLWHGVQK